MKAITLLLTITVALAITALGADVAFAGEQEHDKSMEHNGYSEEAMEAWQKSMTPGDHHKAMKDLVGEWNATVKVWNQPGTEPTVSQGKCQYKLILGDRFLVQAMEGEAMGTPFEGMGLSGYDNLKKAHVTMWVDNMGTAMIYSEGECSDHCRVETHRTTVKDPMTGSDMNVKMVSRIIDKDKHVFEYYLVGDDGVEFKSMEIIYTRVQ